MTIGGLAKALGEIPPTYAKNEKMYWKNVLFDFPGYAPSCFRYRDGGSEIVAVKNGQDAIFILDSRIQEALCVLDENNPVWVGLEGSKYENEWKSVGVVGVFDNGENIIIETAYIK